MADNKALLARVQTGAVDKPRTPAELMLAQVQDKLVAAIPKQIGGDRFLRLLLNVVSKPDVMACDKASIYKAMMDVAASGLEPGRRTYIVPFKNKGVATATVIHDYRGLMELAYRSGMVRDIDAAVVFANDYFVEVRGTDARLEHTPNHDDPGPPKLAYCVATTREGGKVFTVLGPNDARVRRAVRNTPLWRDVPEMGWLKTAVRVTCDRLPQSPEYIAAVDAETRFNEGVPVQGAEPVDAEFDESPAPDLSEHETESGARG